VNGKCKHEMVTGKIRKVEAALLVQRCNGTTAGLGYLEVYVICPCKSPHWAVASCPH
jgi:hypothetical protein